jgi:hypothetical protein
MAISRTRAVALLLSLLATTADAMDVSGNIDLQWRSFVNTATLPMQHDNYLSLSAEPEFYFPLAASDASITFTPFYRYDQYDDERTHADIRELNWQQVFEDFELRAGISKVYWGVTESIHLVDIINQTDAVENVDGEDKLGQPMLMFSTQQDWGVLNLFALPGFRERSFAGIEGRPRFPFVIDGNAALYEDRDAERNIDFAARWFNYLGDWEVGLSYFTGTGREPESYRPIPGRPGFAAPFYAQIDQLGLTVQALIEAWTWKLEAISRDTNAQHFNALAAGFEYTVVGIADSSTDLGVVIEYLYDERDGLLSAASQPVPAVFPNNITTAFRLALNDIQSTEVLLGLTTNIDDQSVAAFIEGSRRIGERIKAELELRTFGNTTNGTPLHSFRDDDFVQLNLGWYY